MEIVNLLITPLSLAITVLFIFFVSVKTFRRFFIFYNHKKVIDLLEYFLEKSYKILYENSIISWIANGMSNTIPSEEKETIERDFIKQSFLIMGTRNHEMFKDFFGDESYLINFMILFVRKKISDDGLADVIKHATDDSSAQITRM